MVRRLSLLTFVLCAAFTNAQEFNLFNRKVAVHGFLSQGFAYTNHNEDMTMNTTDGDVHFTDAGVNLSSAIIDRFRVGAQAYDRKIGKLGQGHISLDWALADYRFTPWFGVRGGKVKTVIGLYNDTQDNEFLHTWALMPQAIYPLDLRSNLLAHTGADIYGKVSSHRFGSVAYTGYWEKVSDDHTNGWYLAPDVSLG